MNRALRPKVKGGHMDKGSRRELRNKMIVLLLVALILLITILIFYVSIQHPGLLIFVGTISIAFFYKVLFYSTPEQRKEKKEVRVRNKEWKHHRFYPISKRARAAYLILCLEESLLFYSQDIHKWEWVLKKLWDVATTDYEEDWVDVDNLLPEEVLAYATYEELEKHYRSAPFPYIHSKVEFAYLQDLYSNVGPALEVIEQLMDHIYDVIVEDWGQDETPHTPSALQYIDQAEQLLREKEIPLPHDEQALNFLISQKDKHFGKPFDGLRFSILSK